VNTDHPQIPESLVRSVLLEILATALKRWRYEGTCLDYAEIEGLGCATIFLFFLGSCAAGDRKRAEKIAAVL
jgi:hypothetical protein